MAMSKRDFIALADTLRPAYLRGDIPDNVLSDIIVFCIRQNPAFKIERWTDFLKGKCGPNGGELK